MKLKITDVRALKGDSAFLIDDGKTSILYDTGFAFTGFDVAKNIKAVLGERSLDYIFLTHSHYDHALGSAYVLEHYPNAKVVAGEYAAKIFAKPTAKAVMRDLDRKFAAANGITSYPDLVDNLKVDIEVKDNDIIKAGDMHFKVLNLPGHTRCSVGFYLESEKLLLGCETLGVFDGDKTIVPSYLVGYDMTIQSIRRVLSLMIEHILMPHHGLMSKEQTRYYLDNMESSAEETCEEIISLIKQGVTKSEIVDRFLKKFYSDKIRTIYPIDAAVLNTGITTSLIAKEFGLTLNE